MKPKTVKEILDEDWGQSLSITLTDGREIQGILSEFRMNKEIDTEGKYLYDIRHSDFDSGELATIEKSVWVNWFGTLILDAPIEIPPCGWLEIEDWNFIDQYETDIDEED